jgi:hypothetical protein
MWQMEAKHEVPLCVMRCKHLVIATPCRCLSTLAALSYAMVGVDDIALMGMTMPAKERPS